MEVPVNVITQIVLSMREGICMCTGPPEGKLQRDQDKNTDQSISSKKKFLAGFSF
jgi:hypothetical protein